MVQNQAFSGCSRNEAKTWQKNFVLANMIETSETHLPVWYSWYTICTKIWTSTPCNRRPGDFYATSLVSSWSGQTV